MNDAARRARYTVTYVRSEAQWALIAEHNDGTVNGTLLGYFDTRAEANAVKADLLTLHGGL